MLRSRALDAVAEAATADDLFGSMSAAVRKLVPYDGTAWFSTDPDTLLPSVLMGLENVTPQSCVTHWDLEYRTQDVLLFRDLARSAVPAGTLLATTGNRPEFSPRYRTLLVPQRYGDELRAALRIGGRTWGMLEMYRHRDRPPFSEADVATVVAVAPAIAAALRSGVVASRPRAAGDTPGVGVALFERDGSLITYDDQAAHWFASLLGPEWTGESPRLSSVKGTVAHAVAVHEGRAWGPSTSRQCSGHGWLTVGASVLTGRNSSGGPVAVTLSPAGSADLVPLLVEAYGLTPRERDVARAVARGRSNQEIAAALSVSPHTVRDHLKAIFAKLAVKTRTELSAALSLPQL